MEEGFEISLNAVTTSQRIKLAQWARSRTAAHAIITEGSTVFAGVFLQPVDFAKFAVSIARSTKRWNIDHVPYTQWIRPLTEELYNQRYKEKAAQLDAQKRERINQELREMGRQPVPDYWDLTDYVDAAELMQCVRRGKRPREVK